MNALTLSVTNKEDAKKLDDVIKHLAKSLDPAWWLTDGRHLVAKGGEKVFNEEKHAVVKLQEMIKNKKSTIAAANLQGFIDGMLDADEALAKVAIIDAANADPKKLAKAGDEMAKGAADENKGKFDTAIEHYRNAWNQALDAMRLAD